MNKIILLILGIGIVGFSSCKKETIEIASNYIPLSVGSYWVYQKYSQNTTTNTWNTLGSTDSTYIDKDTLVGGNVFYKRITTSGTGGAIVDYVRYTANELVDINGNIIFSANSEFTPSLEDTLDVGTGSYFASIYSIDLNQQTVTVNGGTFDCVDWRRGTCQWVTNGVITPKPNIHNYYADGIGLTQTLTYLLSSGTTVKIELENYHIN
jgi:hypothetical protein